MSDEMSTNLKEKIDARAHAVVRERNKWLIGIFAAIALAVVFFLNTYVNGLVNEKIGDVDKTVEEAVKNAVEEAVKNAVEEAVKNAVFANQFESEIAALSSRIWHLDLSPGFSSKEANDIISQINSLASKADESGLSKLEPVLDITVVNFAEADRLDLVKQLEDIASNWYRNSPIVTQTMVQALGLKLLADPRAPDSWKETTGSKIETYDNYRIYVGRAELAGFPELYLLYEILLGYIEGQSTEVIGELIEDAESLNELDAGQFVKLMTALATEEIVNESTAESRRAADRVTGFLCEYYTQGKLLSIAFQQAKIEC